MSDGVGPEFCVALCAACCAGVCHDFASLRHAFTEKMCPCFPSSSGRGADQDGQGEDEDESDERRPLITNSVQPATQTNMVTVSDQPS